jgi:peptidoglycan hydrolase CwlO-like protein
LKPISQAMPTYATQFAPDHAKPVDSMSDMDDEIPFLIMIDKDNQIKALVSEIHNIKKDFAFKLEEIQALYMENKKQSKIIENLHKENKHLKQQIEKLNQEAEEMLLYP